MNYYNIKQHIHTQYTKLLILKEHILLYLNNPTTLLHKHKHTLYILTTLLLISLVYAAGSRLTMGTYRANPMDMYNTCFYSITEGRVQGVINKTTIAPMWVSLDTPVDGSQCISTTYVQ